MRRVAMALILAGVMATPAPERDPCAELRQAAVDARGTMRAEGYVFRMVAAGCPSPPFHLLPPP